MSMLYQKRSKFLLKSSSNSYLKSPTNKQYKNINSLPNEILAEIFSYLSVEDLALRIKNVCPRWTEVLEDSRVWKDKAYVPPRQTQLCHLIKVLKNSPKLEAFHPSRQVSTNKVVLSTLSNYCHNIKKLTLNVFHNRYPDVHELLANKSETLVHLVLHVKVNVAIHGDTGFIQKFLTAVGMCHKLTFFSLSGTVVLNAPDLFIIASSLPSLRHLNLESVCILDSRGWECLLKCKGEMLKSLSFTWLHSFGEEIFAIPSRHCPILEKLSIATLSTCSNYLRVQINKGAFQPLKSMVTLKELTITLLDNMYWNELLDVLDSGALVNLEKLDLSGIQCNGNVLLQVIYKEFSNLKSLILKQCHNLTDNCFQSVMLLHSLEHLDLSGNRKLTNKTVVHLCQCTTLKYLNLDNCSRITTRSLLLCCSELTNLRELHMNRCSIRAHWDVPHQLRSFIRVREPRMLRPVKYSYRALRVWKDSRRFSPY